MNTLQKHRIKQIAEEAKEIKEMLIEFNALYHKHIHDDDSTICKNYADMLKNLKNRIKYLRDEYEGLHKRQASA